MEIIYHRCCGLDVHKRRVSACVRRLEADGRLDQFYFCPETENRKLYSTGTARWQAVKYSASLISSALIPLALAAISR